MIFYYTVLAGAIIGGIFAILVLIIFTCILVFLCHHIKPKKSKDVVSLVSYNITFGFDCFSLRKHIAQSAILKMNLMMHLKLNR